MSSSRTKIVQTGSCPGGQDDCNEQRQRGRQKVHDEATLKARVVEVAFGTFQKHSYNGTTMALVARMPGFPSGRFTSCFRRKSSSSRNSRYATVPIFLMCRRAERPKLSKKP